MLVFLAKKILFVIQFISSLCRKQQRWMNMGTVKNSKDMRPKDVNSKIVTAASEKKDTQVKFRPLTSKELLDRRIDIYPYMIWNEFLLPL